MLPVYKWRGEMVLGEGHLGSHLKLHRTHGRYHLCSKLKWVKWGQSSETGYLAGIKCITFGGKWLKTTGPVNLSGSFHSDCKKNHFPAANSPTFSLCMTITSIKKSGSKSEHCPNDLCRVTWLVHVDQGQDQVEISIWSLNSSWFSSLTNFNPLFVSEGLIVLLEEPLL